MTPEEEKEYLMNIIRKAELTLSTAPEGSIYLQQSNNSTQYFRRINNCRKYIPKEDKKLIAELCSKKYSQIILKAAKQELNLIEDFMEKRNENVIKDIFSELSSSISDYIVPFDLPDKCFVRDWKNASFKTKGIEDDERIILTSNNIRVRSKSEAIIADLLNSHNIPYRYESQLILSSGISNRILFFYPDFTILVPRTREELIWEHFGLMDNPSYVSNVIAKINIYSQNGYVLGKNLVCTFENKENPLQSSTVERIIKCMIVN